MSQHGVVNVVEDEQAFGDFTELFEGAVQRVLFRVGVESLEKLRGGGVPELEGGDEPQDRVLNRNTEDWYKSHDGTSANRPVKSDVTCRCNGRFSVPMSCVSI